MQLQGEVDDHLDVQLPRGEYVLVQVIGGEGELGVEEEGQRLVQQVGKDGVHQGGEQLLQLGYQEEQEKESLQTELPLRLHPSHSHLLNW